ncbi:MAG TPA: flagellar basal body P-ring protein FlgI [Planctomycetota bacterium]|nr:flagellar basal body P-ring protein FlgI [Planctomycetota bacterium]
MRHIFFGMDVIFIILAGAAQRRQMEESANFRPANSQFRRVRRERGGDDDSTVRMLARVGVILLALMISIPATEVPATDAPVVAAPVAADGIRLKDLCDIYGVRDNQLHGIGVVVGLSGTGDKTPATVRMLRQLLATKHLSFSESDLQSKNVAMVAVTADLPAFARNGSRLYTQISCLGDATSLKGGVLLQTPLVAADERIYAVAQGTATVGGFGNAGPNIASTGIDHKNIETVGTLAAGAMVEREVPVSLLYGDRLRLILKDSDFTTASRVAKVLSDLYGPERVTAEDATMITLSFAQKPTETDLVSTIAQLQQLRVSPDMRARVVINARTGTVVAGSQVRISEVAVSHGGLSLRVTPVVERRTDPNDRNKIIDTVAWVDPLTRQRTPEPPPGIIPTPQPGTFSVLTGATVEDIANGLNALGARPRDLVAIFEAIQRAGALHAELVVM